MGLLSRTPKPQGYQPTDNELQDAANRLNAGSHHAAWDLTLHSRDYSQQTAMRILAASIDHNEDHSAR